MRIYASLAKIVAIASLLTTALVGRNATASDFLDVSGMKAIYDAETGSLRFEGLFNIHGVGIGRNDKASFRPEGAATTQASFSVANEEEAGWLFLDGIEGGTFDAGAIFPAGLTDGLSNFYIGVSSIGSGKNVTPIPIYTPSGAYLPNFDLFAPSMPIVETPPIQEPVVPAVPGEPVLPVEPVVELPPPADPPAPENDPVVAPEIDPVVVPPVVNVDDLEPPPDEGVPTIIDIVSQPGNRIEIWRPTDEWRFTYELTWEETQTFVDWGGRLLSYVDLDGVDYDGIVELTGLSADLTQFTSLLLTTSVNSTSLSTGRLMGAMSFAGRSDVQVAVPEPSVGVLLLGAIVGLKAARRQFKR